MKYSYKIGFIGGGVMATPIIEGLLKSKEMKSSDILVADPFVPLTKGVEVTTDNYRVLTECESVVLAVKPQVFYAIKDEMAKCKAQRVISIIAGVTTNTISGAVPKGLDIVRAMPNTPCKVGEGMVCLADTKMSDNTREVARVLFSSIARVEVVKEELFDAVTSISGSGPAYIMMFINALTKAGMEGGLPLELAKSLATQTVLGGAKLVSANMTTDIQLLIDAVCSKGGTTIEAVKKFSQGDLDGLVSVAVKACRDRSEELSRA